MTDFIVDRAKITKKVLSIINPDYTSIDLDRAKSSWWMNMRPGGGLRLTNEGYTAFDRAGLEFWDLPESDNPLEYSAATIIRMDQYLPCPYFILRVRENLIKVTLYDSRIVVLVQLNGGMKQYLDNLSTKRSDLG